MCAFVYESSYARIFLGLNIEVSKRCPGFRRIIFGM